MKLRRILVVMLVFVMLFTLTGCNNINFMSANAAKKLADEYGTPTMTMTVEYTLDEKVVTLELEYDLLLEKAPITVVNFINLVEDGFYNEVVEGEETTSHVFSTRDSSANAWYAGSYTVTTTTELDEDENEIDPVYSKAEALDYTIKGEFVQNGWVIPAEKDAVDEEGNEITDNNAHFDLFALAMYHGNTNITFDNGGSQFFLTTSSRTTENYLNYAVFAYLKAMTVSINGEFVATVEGVDSAVYEEINEELITTGSKKLVYTNDAGAEVEEKITMLDNIFRIVSIEMTDSNDYTNLPTNYTINK